MPKIFVLRNQLLEVQNLLTENEEFHHKELTVKNVSKISSEIYGKFQHEEEDQVVPDLLLEVEDRLPKVDFDDKEEVEKKIPEFPDPIPIPIDPKKGKKMIHKAEHSHGQYSDHYFHTVLSFNLSVLHKSISKLSVNHCRPSGSLMTPVLFNNTISMHGHDDEQCS